MIDELLESSRSVQDGEWAKVPSDGTENLDRSCFARVHRQSLDIDVAVFADWLAAQASDRLWTVDGESRIQETVPLPCSGGDLAAVLRSTGRRMRVFAPDRARATSAGDMADWADEEDGGLIFELAWLSDGEPGDHWLISEDRLAEEADRAASQDASR